ncbi:MAG: hypothetical protein J7500_15220 [Sphingomonas sp.]|uniref:hypothetical protein n=1 Tax=Sphingomonas sp. TaxID=28214 RepID=UPI001B065ACA|nr:hypothetical protein [Sphingomonas sp.]MBO9624057.1 hypothetical protein [Sphingomonas sp.]
MTTGGNVVPIAAAAAARARRRVINHFCVWHATSPQDAIEYSPPSLIEQRQFDRLLKAGVIKAALPGLYWVDLAAREAADERRRRKLVPLVIGASVAIAVALLLLYR